jgi:hypothetical protein
MRKKGPTKHKNFFLLRKYKEVPRAYENLNPALTHLLGICRINTDWLWENFPNERRFASMIFVSDNNILVPEVIQVSISSMCLRTALMHAGPKSTKRQSTLKARLHTPFQLFDACVFNF